jgi:hypothetical protein
VEAVPVTDAAKYTASQLGYGGGAAQHWSFDQSGDPLRLTIVVSFADG